MRMKLVKNEPQYWEFLRSLRNDERVKDGFIQQEHITSEQHMNYMMVHGDIFYVCLVDDMPAGYIRVLGDDIGVCTHPDFQKRGVGKFMVNEIAQQYPDACARIKIKNEASIRLFESCGFKKKYFLLEKEDSSAS